MSPAVGGGLIAVVLHDPGIGYEKSPGNSHATKGKHTNPYSPNIKLIMHHSTCGDNKLTDIKETPCLR